MKVRNLSLLLGVVAVFMFCLTAFYFGTWKNLFFSANVLQEFPVNYEFDGLQFPIDKVPDWLKVDKKLWAGQFADISPDDLMDLPRYDADSLSRSAELLDWKNPVDLETREAKLTYLVAYMGNYLLDGRENAGSHLAVDIRVPEGTPVKVMGKGVVVKVGYDEFGFGKHVVVRHDNFPSFDDPSVRVTYFSNYCHLSEISVKEGDFLTKGTLIGKSGTTGSSSLPHLHFQIDKDTAPWHPFWPFTANELRGAGINFIQAINQGFNHDRALENTINPMMYVEKYQDYRLLFSDVSSPVAVSRINKLVAAKILTGYDDGTFRPNAVINRAEAIKMILSSYPEPLSDGGLPFVDVDEEAWYARYLSQAYSSGLVGGYEDGTFRPDQAVNRAEFLKILINGSGHKVAQNGFEPWYQSYYRVALENGLLADEGYDFSGFMTRGEAADLIYLALDRL